MRKTSTFGAAVVALAASGWIATAAAQAPADAPPAPSTDTTATAPDTKAPAKPMHHKMMHHAKGKLVATAKGDAEVEDLNAKSLDAAKEGKSFTPPTTPMSEPAAHAGDKSAKPMKHKMMKHKAAKKTEAAAPADTSTPAAPPAPEPAPAPAPAPTPAPAPAPAPSPTAPK